jgi:predicted tellurium resistance membrane protein TerC
MSLEIITALLALIGMEIVLGIDNIVFISIVAEKVPADRRDRVRKLGIGVALLFRLGLLFSISWVMGLKEPLFSIFNHSFSGRDLILLGGGLFLLTKATHEIHDNVNADDNLHTPKVKKLHQSIPMILGQIILLDIVFSLDSVITAVGMADELWVMVVAMTIAMVVMLFSAKSIGNFVENHPTIKILALSFLLLIGVMLVAESMGQHINKGYIYFAMTFSLFVEALNMRYRKKHTS